MNLRFFLFYRTRLQKRKEDISKQTRQLKRSNGLKGARSKKKGSLLWSDRSDIFRDLGDVKNTILGDRTDVLMF